MRLVLDGRYIQNHFPGIGRYTYNLATALGRSAGPTDEVLVLIDRAAANDRFDLDALSQSPRLSLCDITAPVFSPMGAVCLSLNLHQLDADVYHSPHYLFPPVPRGRAVVTLFDLIPAKGYDRLDARTRLRRGVYCLCIGAALRRAARVIVPSERTKADLARWRGGRVTKIARIPIGVDPSFAPVSQAAVDNLRLRYHLPDRFVLTLGINKPHKNHPRLVRAFQLPAIPGDASLVVAGPIDSRFPTASDVASSLGIGSRVRLLGEVPSDDLPALYAAADVFAFPSLDEGFGLPPLEAMGCGTPVACARAGALPEVVGDAARMFDPLDCGDIADTIGSLMTDSLTRTRLREAGLVRSACFHWNAVAEATWQVYRDTLAA